MEERSTRDFLITLRCLEIFSKRCPRVMVHSVQSIRCSRCAECKRQKGSVIIESNLMGKGAKQMAGTSTSGWRNKEPIVRRLFALKYCCFALYAETLRISSRFSSAAHYRARGAPSFSFCVFGASSNPRRLPCGILLPLSSLRAVEKLRKYVVREFFTENNTSDRKIP